MRGIINEGRGEGLLAVDIFPMTNNEEQHSQAIVLQITDQSIIANPIPPKSPLVAMESFAHRARIITALNLFVEETINLQLGRTRKLSDLSGGGGRNLNVPSQAYVQVLSN